MVKSLVTGGAGFIGSHVVKHLLEMGHQVVMLDDLSGGFRENVADDALFVEGSITDKQLVEQLFDNHRFTYVYHLAAYAAEGLSHFIRRFNYENNLMGSVNLINAAVNYSVKCFVFTSSIAVYGTNILPMIETATPQPEDPYGIAKYAVELDLKAAKELFGLNYLIFRPHNVFGEYQNIGDKYRNVIGIFMNQLLQGQPLTIYGDGQQTRAFSYIDDVAPYIAQSVLNQQAYNQVFNIGGGKNYTINELAKAVMIAIQQQGEIVYLPARNEVKHAYADHQKIHRFFNISPKNTTDLAMGLSKMAKWVQQHGARQTKAFEDIEIHQQLPANWRA